MALAHQHLILRAAVQSPPKCRTLIEDWLRLLVQEVDMKILMGPYSVYSEMIGNRGLTAACIIETSHCVLHSWDEEFPAMLQLDLYSCKCFEVDTIIGMLDVFEPVWVHYKMFDRDYNITLTGENYLTSF